MTNWESFRLRRERKDRKRRERLLNKLQKAQAIKRREEVERLSTWSRRFGQVCRLRSQRQKGNQ
jgi:hypothetical protein